MEFRHPARRFFGHLEQRPVKIGFLSDHFWGQPRIHALMTVPKRGSRRLSVAVPRNREDRWRVKGEGVFIRVYSRSFAVEVPVFALLAFFCLG